MGCGTVNGAPICLGLNVTSEDVGGRPDLTHCLAALTESISRFLNEPVGWTRVPEDDQERQAAIARVRRAVLAAMHALAMRRLVEEHLAEWRTAYEYKGTGSTFQRARVIRGIYDEAAPLPDAVMPPASKKFLAEVRQIVTGAIEASGGRVRLGEVV